jgi:hypothetical protein
MNDFVRAGLIQSKLAVWAKISTKMSTQHKHLTSDTTMTATHISR